jgi:hypothetical protein
MNTYLLLKAKHRYEWLDGVQEPSAFSMSTIEEQLETLAILEVTIPLERLLYPYPEDGGSHEEKWEVIRKRNEFEGFLITNDRYKEMDARLLQELPTRNTEDDIRIAAERILEELREREANQEKKQGEESVSTSREDNKQLYLRMKQATVDRYDAGVQKLKEVGMYNTRLSPEEEKEHKRQHEIIDTLTEILIPVPDDGIMSMEITEQRYKLLDFLLKNKNYEEVNRRLEEALSGDFDVDGIAKAAKRIIVEMSGPAPKKEGQKKKRPEETPNDTDH